MEKKPLIFLFRYTIDKWLSPTLDDQQLFIELSKEPPPGNQFYWRIFFSSRYILLVPSIYFINIKTFDVNQAEINENIEMSIHGSNGEIAKFLLKNCAKNKDKELFQRGNDDQFEIEHDNIGNVKLKFKFHKKEWFILFLIDWKFNHRFQWYWAKICMVLRIYRYKIPGNYLSVRIILLN